MPLQNRKLSSLPSASTPSKRWTHTVTSNAFEAGIKVAQGRVVEADPILHSIIGKRMDAVRQHCAKVAWIINETK